jgi:ribonuclease P protein component
MISLKNKREFDQVFKGKQSKANRYLVMYVKKNQLKFNRLGISVSKKVGNSVVRHRVTRLIREAYRLNKDQIVLGYDIIVIARNTTKGTKFAVIEDSFLHLIKTNNLLNT